MHQCPLNPSSQPKLLLAEDDPDQSEMLAEVLQEEGYDVETAFSGEAAEQKLLHRPYELVILDIRMPGLDGESVLRRMRARTNTAQTPVVVVSAFATDSEMKRYKQQGASASFSKPYQIGDLLACINQFVPPHRNGGSPCFKAAPQNGGGRP